MMSTTVASLPPATQPIPYKPASDDEPEVPEYAFSELWQDKKEGMTFGDVLDIVNPLQHIPVVSTIYRLVTGDEIGIGSRLLGGALFGGPLGFLATGLTAILEEVSGGTVDERVASLWHSLTGEDAPATMLASTDDKDHAPTEPPPVDDELAADTARPGPQPDGPRPVAAPAPVVAMMAAAPYRPSPQPLPRPPVSVSPLMAVHRVHHQAPRVVPPRPAPVNHEADRQRITQAIQQAQRAQAGLLLAQMGADGADRTRQKAERTAVPEPMPFKSHPYMLPRGAPPELVRQAMERAMAKYQAVLQQRNAAAAAGG